MGRQLLLAALSVGAVACQHTQASGRGAECVGFVEHDATTRRQLDALLTDAPGDRLVTEASRLNRERRACARQVLAALPELRERSGVQAVQRELDALTATYRAEDLDALLAEALGEDAAPLRPLLAEARVRHDRESRAAEAQRRDTRASRRDGSDARAFDALERHRADADREGQALLREHDAASRKADREATGLLGQLDGAGREADRDASAALGKLDGARRDADRDASAALGKLDGVRRDADRDSSAALGKLDGARRDADRDASAAVGSLDGARRDADRDAHASLGDLDEARRRADRDALRQLGAAGRAGTAGTELPPLRAADDATAEALRSLDGPTEATGPCAASSACRRLECDELRTDEANALARRCLDDAAPLSLDSRARQVAAVLAALRRHPAMPSATEALTTLETLRRRAWPGVEAAAKQGQRGLAAQRASPFLALDGARAEVQRLRDEAQAHHLRRAQALASTPVAAWLHARLAEELGGPVTSSATPTGRWGPPRWRCAQEAPRALPTAPAGVELTLHLSCSEPSRSTDTSALRTFDLGAGGLRVEGFLAASCADRAPSFPFRLEEPGVSGFPAEAFDAELARLIGVATRVCREQHELGALRDCAELQRKTPADLQRRFTLHALATRSWATCFREWLEVTEGVGPPELP